MLLPIVTIGNATGTGEEATASLRHASLPAGPRSEAIRKIVDALILHLSGKEVASKDALVKLIGDLALILKFPPLPQESGRAFVRRLINFLETMPVPERLAVERQLAGPGLAPRLAAPVTMPVSRTGASPPDQSPLRSLPLPAAVPRSVAAKALPTGDVALLQALLRKTYGADMESLGTREIFEDKAPEAAPSRAEPQRVPKAAGSTRSLQSAEAAPAARTEAAPARTLPVESSLPLDSEGSAQEVLTDHTTLPPPTGTGGGTNSETPSSAPLERTETAIAEQATVTAEASTEEVVDGLEPDGTYGAPRTGDDAQMPRPPAGRETDSLTPRSLAETVKSLVFPATAEAGQPAVPENITPPEADGMPPTTRESATLNRDVAAGGEPPNEAASANEADVPLPDTPPRSSPRHTGEDAATPQAVARLVEFGLPREVVPFTLVPYPPAQAASGSDADEVERREREDEDEAGKNARGKQESGGQEHGSGSRDEDGETEEPAAADAYDLYRKLGDLG